MSKAYRKKQKENAEEKLLKAAGQIEEQDEKPKNNPFIVEKSSKPQKNMFSGFMLPQESSSEEDEIEQDEAQKEEITEKNIDEVKETSKDNKKEDINEDKTEKAKKKKKRNRKKKAKKQEEEKESDKDDNDLDKEDNEMIEEENNDTFLEISSIFQDNCLSIIKNNFNYNKELSSHFKGMRLTDSTDYGNLNKRQIAQMKHMQKKYKPLKSFYQVYNDEVFGALPDKLQCEFIKTNQYNHKVFAFKPTKKFLSQQETYKEIKNTHDPNNMFQFSHVNPYYPEAFYDCGEFMRLQGDMKAANKLLEQGLYFYEECFTYEFMIFSNNQNDTVVLDYDYNLFTKICFKCIFKMISILQNKGCYRSAQEYNKLQLKLNPIQDPCGALLYMDYNAISAKQYDWYMNFAIKFADHYYNKNDKVQVTIIDGVQVNSKIQRNSILLYPNVQFSFALCKFQKELKNYNPDDINSSIVQSFKEDLEFEDVTTLKNINIKKSHNFFGQLAILLYPKLLLKIVEKTEMNKQNLSNSKFRENQKKNWSEIFDHKFFFRDEKDYNYFFLEIGNDDDTKGLEKIIEIYPERTKAQWKSNPINLWLKMQCGCVLNWIEEGKLNLDDFTENQLVMPEDLEGKFHHMLPFEPRIHKKLLFDDFSDTDQRLDQNNIQDNDPLAGEVLRQVQDTGDNPVDLNQGGLSLFMQSLMPWNHLPDQNQQQPPEQISQNSNYAQINVFYTKQS